MVKHQQKPENPSDDSVAPRSSSVRDGAIPSSRSSAAGRFGKGRGKHQSHEKNPGWLGYIGDEILPSYTGIIINHCKDPY